MKDRYCGMTGAPENSGLTREEIRVAIFSGNGSALWERVQRGRCRENIAHPRYLLIAGRRGKDKIALDLGPCQHAPLTETPLL
jgi:hypothetical protein